MPMTAEYECDFHGWITHNVALLRAGRLSEIDAEHIAEELESMGKRDLRQLRSRLQVLVMHLLKWQFQPAHRSSSWRGSILEQRLRIRDLLQDCPSLKPFLPEAVAAAYADSAKLAGKETGLSITLFPTQPPYALDLLLDDDWFPDEATSVR